MKKKNRKNALSIESSRNGDGQLRLAFSGRLGVDEVDHCRKTLKKISDSSLPAAVVLDLGNLEYLDTSGAMVLELFTAKAPDTVNVSIQGANAKFESMLRLIDPNQVLAEPINKTDRQKNFVEDLGRGARAFGQDVSHIIAFVGQVTKGFGYLLRRPGSLRMGDVLASMQAVGVEGLSIVALIGLLLGMIMAFMSSLQLKSFGADVYVATLVAVAMVRELGPIMTSILVAGRSGSAFAAEIGTMRVNEEVDALEVMGYDSTIFLALPKIIAAVLMVPILNLFAIAAAIIGGMFVGIAGLDLTPYTYINQTMASFDIGDLFTSMAKSSVFGLLIAIIGCQRGFVVSGGASGVGKATTGAVVAALFLIIVTDSVFAIVQYYFL